MNIKELQCEIEKLPEPEKHIIQNIENLDDKEMETAVGGLSDQTKNLLLFLGALGLAGATGTAGLSLGRTLGRSKGMNEGVKLGVGTGRNEIFSFVNKFNTSLKAINCAPGITDEERAQRGQALIAQASKDAEKYGYRLNQEQMVFVPITSR